MPTPAQLTTIHAVLRHLLLVLSLPAQPDAEDAEGQPDGAANGADQHPQEPRLLHDVRLLRACTEHERSWCQITVKYTGTKESK